MRIAYLVLFCCFGQLYGQSFKLSGNWSGIITDSLFTKSHLALLQIKGINGHATGIFRIETSEGFCQYEVTGAYKKKKHFILTSSGKALSESKGFNSSPFEFAFHYDDSSEYVVGTLHSAGSAFHRFKLYLEWDESPYILNQENSLSNIGAQAMAHRLKLNIPAKSKRMKELARFQFVPIYFEVDRFEIDSTYFPYLEKLTRILNSHSDLRLKIIGHTDADGSDEYNILLSKNRANAIFQYFMTLGISSDRMIFEFQGESKPAESNENERGKQRNRRVEFAFI